VSNYDDGERLVGDERDIDALTDREWIAIERLEARLRHIAAIDDDVERWEAIHEYQRWLAGAT
jgi:hypothetical protein